MSDEKKMGRIEFSFWPSGENPYERMIELSAEVPTEVGIGELHDLCKKFMFALGYTEKTIDEYFGESIWDE